MQEAIALSSTDAPAVQREHRFDTPIVLGAYAVLVVVTFAWGRFLDASGKRMGLRAPPLYGHFDTRISVNVVPVVILAVVAVIYLPRLAAHMRWSRLLILSVATAFLWAVALALVDGPDGFLGTLESRFDYLPAVSLVDRPLSFLSHFTEDIAQYPVHVQGHPPGMPLFLWSLASLGLAGAWWAATALVVAGASATAAALLTVRELAGERTARSCVPFLVVGPASIWIATSADALYLALSAWGIALFVLATGRRDATGDFLAGAAGLVIGASLFFSYGVAPLGLVVGAVALTRRRLRPLLVACAGGVLVGATFAAAGFWWPAGLEATIERYEAGIAARRPYGFFLVGNLAAFAVALGPAVAVGVARLRDRRLWVLVGAALLALAAADLSGLSKGEVERIWLPFVPWVVVAAAALHCSKRWLGIQAGAAVAVAVLVRTPW
jgi:methylthioxylose transferase